MYQPLGMPLAPSVGGVLGVSTPRDDNDSIWELYDEERKVRGREAAKRSRQRKKQQFVGLFHECEALRKENIQLRAKLGVPVLDVTSATSNEVDVVRRSYTENVPDKVMSCIMGAVECRRQTNDSISHVISELSKILPGVALFEIRIWVSLTWLRIKRSSVPPTDPLLISLADSDLAHVTAEERERMLQHVETNFERLFNLGSDMRRARKHVEELQKIGKRLETENAWFSEWSAKTAEIYTPEQLASFYMWNDQHLGELQEKVLGYKMEMPQAKAAATTSKSFSSSPESLPMTPPGAGTPSSSSKPAEHPPALRQPLPPAAGPKREPRDRSASVEHPPEPSGSAPPPAPAPSFQSSVIRQPLGAPFAFSPAGQPQFHPHVHPPHHGHAPADRKRGPGEEWQAPQPRLAPPPPLGGSSADADVVRVLMRQAVMREVNCAFPPAPPASAPGPFASPPFVAPGGMEPAGGGGVGPPSMRMFVPPPWHATSTAVMPPPPMMAPGMGPAPPGPFFGGPAPSVPLWPRAPGGPADGSEGAAIDLQYGLSMDG